MAFNKPMSLQTKFLIGLAVFALSSGLFFGGTLFFHLRSVMLSEVSDKSNLILAQADAVQDYVRRDLRPSMFKLLPPDSFVMEAMSSSYISRHIMERLNVKDDHYYYRRVALNARNPDFMPNDLEHGIIMQFRMNNDMKRWEGDSVINGERYHLTARPVVFEKSCMRCHGNPDNAPKELLNQYGRKRGFGYKVGLVSGVVVAGFPVKRTFNQIMDITFGYLIMYLTAVVMFFAMVSVYFNQLVVHNLHRLTSIFRRYFSGPEEQNIIERLGSHDEIEGLVGGIEELAGHLNRAKKDLETYAYNLEEMVADRTYELNEEAKRHQSDVNLFVNLLRGLNQSKSRPDMVAHAVKQIGCRFDAEYVIYYCTVLSKQIVAWPVDTPGTGLPRSWKELLSKNKVISENNKVYIPVKSQDCEWGILGISWGKGKKPPKITKEVLLAIGQQLGIALENIHAINNLIHQKDMLKSVFEGISDPLLLLDATGNILMANRWAKIFIKKTKMETKLISELKSVIGLDKSGTKNNPVFHTFTNQTPWARSVRLFENRSFRISIYPIAIYKKEPDCIILYARENTEEKRMLARLQRTEKLSAIGQLAAGLAHEINNPLGVIRCYTDILMNEITEEQARSDLEVIARHTGNAQQVLQNLLGFARPKTSVSETCRINKVIQSVIKVFEVQAGTKSAQIHLELAAGLPPIRGDAITLEHIITNLWLNALDAVPSENGHIWIRTRLSMQKKEVHLMVGDNGPGIPERDMENIFDPFFTTKDVGQGTGMGLAVVYGLTKELKARIEVENQNGAVFNIYLPSAL